eukprot:Hpha_TRINITY_DN14678_c0_g5::TRINITY_DN14678_c0_g5_i1::g.48589::m.48589
MATRGCRGVFSSASSATVMPELGMVVSHGGKEGEEGGLDSLNPPLKEESGAARLVRRGRRLRGEVAECKRGVVENELKTPAPLPRSAGELSALSLTWRPLACSIRGLSTASAARKLCPSAFKLEIDS